MVGCSCSGNPWRIHRAQVKEIQREVKTSLLAPLWVETRTLGETASQGTAILDSLSGFVKSNGGPARSYRDVSEWWIRVVFLCSNKRLGDRLESACAYNADAETEAPILLPPDAKR